LIYIYKESYTQKDKEISFTIDTFQIEPYFLDGPSGVLDSPFRIGIVSSSSSFMRLEGGK
jgi:hypothetical protein